MKAKVIALILILSLGLLPGCGGKPAAQVAATTLPVYQFTAALCEGTDIQVEQLITQSVSCLHDYSLSVSQVKALESAQVVVISGAGLEEFMEDLIPETAALIDSSQTISLLESCGHHHQEEEGHHHEEDPHIWLSPANASIMADNIAQGLQKAYPDHAQTIAFNLTQLQQKLQRLADYGREQLDALSCRELITFHDGFGYFADAFDLHILEAIEEESGSEASARELKEMIGLVTAHQLPAIFTETNGSASAAQVIAAETGVAVYALDMAMAGQDYFEAMYHNIDTIREAMK